MRSAALRVHIPGIVLACLLGFLAVASCGGPDAPPRNLILISVDTLRSDHLGAYGSTRGLTPNLDALAEESQLFEYAYAPSSFTLASVASLLTGRYPEEVGVEWNQSVLAPEVPTLAQLLRDRGFQTAAVVSNFVLRRKKSGIDAGFEHFDDIFLTREAIRGFPERNGDDTSAAALAALGMLSGKDGPFFPWVHFQDPHGPYTPGETERARFFDGERAQADPQRGLPLSNDRRGMGAIPSYQYIAEHTDPEFYRAGYEAEIHRVDAALGRLVEGIASRGRLDDSLVVFASDHGESLGEDGYWFAHGEYLSDALVRVPLMFRIPGRPALRHRVAVSLVDVVPTAMTLLGLDAPESISGRDLFAEDSDLSGRPIYLAALREALHPRFGLVVDGYKYRLTPRLPGDTGRRGPRRELLHRLGDESSSLLAEDPARARAMSRRLLQMRQGFDIPGEAGQTQDLTPAERRQLEALGYVGGSSP
jgi:arylsulfatase A-like enzyme